MPNRKYSIYFIKKIGILHKMNFETRKIQIVYLYLNKKITCIKVVFILVSNQYINIIRFQYQSIAFCFLKNNFGVL